MTVPKIAAAQAAGASNDADQHKEVPARTRVAAAAKAAAASPKAEAPQPEHPKGDTPKAQATKSDATKSDETKSDATKTDTAKRSDGCFGLVGDDCKCKLKVNARETFKLAIILSLLYWSSIVVVRWHRIAHPTRELLRAQITSLQRELDQLALQATLNPVRALLEAAADLNDESKAKFWSRVADVLFWSRGQELTGWGYVHEVERQLASFLPLETVQARLEAVERDLRASNDAGAIALANTIHNSPPSSTPLPRLQALLADALETNYDREDTSFAALVSWQNKTSWLVIFGLLLITVLVGLDPARGILFLVGATGGLISRLSRSLDRKDVPTDYGASWATLFLSPVSGALGAWAGILVTGLAVQLGVLADKFADLWSCPFSQLTLALALVFGFSERLLDTILDKLVTKTGGESASGPSQKPPPPAAATSDGGSAAASPQTLKGAQVTQAYSEKLPAPQVDPNAQWSVVSGQLPTGLALGPDGTLAGTPGAATAGKTFDFSAAATSAGKTQTLAFRITVK